MNDYRHRRSSRAEQVAELMNAMLMDITTLDERTVRLAEHNLKVQEALETLAYRVGELQELVSHALLSSAFRRAT